MGNDFVRICHVENHVLQREQSAIVSWMTRIGSDRTFMNDPVLRYITSDSFFSNPTFGLGPFRLPWPEISLLTLHLVLDPFRFSQREKLSYENVVGARRTVY